MHRFALTFLLVLCASTAMAQSLDAQWQSCVREEDLVVSMAACTAVIQSGQADKSRLAYAYYNRGNSHWKKTQATLAIADFDKAIALEPDLEDAWYLRGLAKMFNGDLAGRDADLAKAREIKARLGK